MYKCPCCHQSRGIREIKYVQDLIAKLGPSAFVNSDLEDHDPLREKHLPWACDICIDNGVAELIAIQEDHHSWYPYLSYFDNQQDCVWCSTEYTFSKEEKKHWFEELRFSFETLPVHCEACKKEFREGTPEQERCSELLEKGRKQLTPKEISEVISIYKSWNRYSKIRYS